MKQISLHTFFLKKKVLFPHCTLAVSVRTTETIRAGDRVLAIPLRFPLDFLLPRSRIATLAEVTEVRENLQTVKMSLKGLARVRIGSLINLKKKGFEQIEPEPIGPHDAIIEELRKKSQELVFLINVEESDKLIGLLNYIFDLDQLTDFISNYFILDFPARYRLYNETGTRERSRMLVHELAALIKKMTEKRKKRSYEKDNNRQ